MARKRVQGDGIHAFCDEVGTLCGSLVEQDPGFAAYISRAKEIQRMNGGREAEAKRLAESILKMLSYHPKRHGWEIFSTALSEFKSLTQTHFPGKIPADIFARSQDAALKL